MKKIVAGLAALAMAASVFAVDVASMIQLDGRLMAYDDAYGFRAVEVNPWDPQGTSDFVWKFSASGDKSGATLWAYTTTETDTGDTLLGKQKLATDYNLSEYSLWFKPADWLKVTVGNVYASSALNPQFGWWAKTAEFAKYGYQCDFTFDALSFSVILAPGQNTFWLDTKKSGYAMIGDFWVDVKYNIGSIGTVQAYVSKGVGLHPHGFTGWKQDSLAFGALFGNCPYMQNGYFVEVAAGFGEDWGDTTDLSFGKVVSTLYGQYFVSGWGFQFINEFAYADKFSYGFEFKARYALDSGWTPYVQILGYEIMDKKMEFDLGIGGNVGSCAIDAHLALPLTFASGYKFNFSVPVQFTVNL
ncbi:MAG: hypothetical protein K6D95_09605 [Treponema sp.]|nr:hypothetical protein [Treponema sp.]